MRKENNDQISMDMPLNVESLGIGEEIEKASKPADASSEPVKSVSSNTSLTTLLAAAPKEIRIIAEKLINALLYVKNGAIIKGEDAASVMSTDMRVGYALKSSIIHSHAPALARAICAKWDMDQGGGCDSVKWYQNGKADHPRPVALGTIYKLAQEEEGYSGTGTDNVEPQKPPITPPPFPAFSPEEVDTARLSPRCIVDGYLYADLALVAAAGGTGKTTTMIYEAVCIALGLDLWGLKVWNPGPVLFITAEDSRELFAARLREVMAAMDLTPYERNKALSRVAVWDVSGELVRLAELDQGGNIQLTSLADDIVNAYQKTPPAIIVIDPCVSFGPGERIVNDGEQAVVTACRRIIRGLDCCVRIIHHTGKVNARDGATDQYASRGGTALPDGSRMVAILSSVDDETTGAPEGFELTQGDSGFKLVRAKLSYAPPQPVLWVRRRDYAFDYFTESKPTKEQRETQKAEAGKRQTEADTKAVLQYIKTQLEVGTKHNASTLEAMYLELGMTRARVRAALIRLTNSHHIVDDDLPLNERQGRKRTYLKPAADFGGIAPKAPEPAQNIPPFNSAEFNSAAYRENEGGGIEVPPPLTLFLILPRIAWRNSAELAELKP